MISKRSIESECCNFFFRKLYWFRSDIFNGFLQLRRTVVYERNTQKLMEDIHSHFRYVITPLFESSTSNPKTVKSKIDIHAVFVTIFFNSALSVVR